ncbi:MAG TPA: HAMP domain-containing sensor histidine kinase [Pirellulales bacterium]|nr:HAMP domain-containing sensor histidine kinase [Pirellulales bacterium]
MSEFDERLTAAKLEAMAEFAAGAGHEINNPIAVIAGRAQLLLDGETDPQRRRELAVIQAQAMRVYEMIADMMLFARPPAPRLADCDMATVAENVVAELAGKAREKQVRLELQTCSQPFTLSADANQLAVAVQALCQNALDAVDRGGCVSVSVERLPAANIPGEDRIAITVADDGGGIAADAQEHLFDPFYCGRPAGRRLGMGLAKAWRIVRNHRGWISAENRPTGGAMFMMVLPATVTASEH